MIKLYYDSNLWSHVFNAEILFNVIFYVWEVPLSFFTALYYTTILEGDL